MVLEQVKQSVQQAVKIPCRNCGKFTLRLEEEFIDKNNYLRATYKCSLCGRKISRIKKRPKGSIFVECPRCKQSNTSPAGFYKRAIDRQMIRRYTCYNCERSFSLDKSMMEGSRRIPAAVHSFLLKEVGTIKDKPSPADPTKSLYYSARELARLVFKEMGIKISKTYTGAIITHYRIVKVKVCLMCNVIFNSVTINKLTCSEKCDKKFWALNRYFKYRHDKLAQRMCEKCHGRIAEAYINGQKVCIKCFKRWKLIIAKDEEKEEATIQEYDQ